MDKNKIIVISGIAVTMVCLGIAAIPFMKSYQDKQAKKKLWEEKMARKNNNPDPNPVQSQQEVEPPVEVAQQPREVGQPESAELKEVPANLTHAQPEPAKEQVPAGADYNPFLNKEERKAFKELGNAIPLDGIELSAIMYSREVKQAILNGQIVKEGDLFDGKEIVEIRPEEVVLKDRQSQYLVRMKPVFENTVKEENGQ